MRLDSPDWCLQVALLQYQHEVRKLINSKPGQQATTPKNMEGKTLEQRIAEQPAPKVTESRITERIASVEYANPFPSTPHFTVCGIKMKNGFLVTGESAPVSPENFNREIGQELAYKDAFRKLWALEGYVLATNLIITNEH